VGQDSHVTESDPAVRVLSLVDDAAVRIGRGVIEWVPVRRRLGIRSFGTNAFRAARRGDPVIEEHVESPGQQELYVVLQGRARFKVNGQDIDAAPGTAVFVEEPDLRRSATAVEDDTVVLAVGGWPDRPYHALPWEPIYLAQEAMRQGKWADAAETLEREAGEHRDSAFLRYRLACCHAQSGAPERALEELRLAVEVNPAMRERATTDPQLEPLREHHGWSAAMG
jgi:tetratricopeptide (TPR) repeat protein